ncbi:hypothetical protein G7Z17_g883 [Cylindrodendrum hubeiense]|uniref:Ribonuclease H n=1 Tax=Cylindrodendrum hubeiense TaxID=595255 RepID=A0A9P5HGW9_9HYPO|nr:hypothetical protein G7Z17_g883 [Cylindrodendrum hubeiense]
MGKKFYAVAVGKETGVFNEWVEIFPLVNGFKGAKHKSFNTYEEADEFVQLNGSESTTTAVLPTQNATIRPDVIQDPPRAPQARHEEVGDQAQKIPRRRRPRGQPKERDTRRSESHPEAMRKLESQMQFHFHMSTGSS